MRSKHLNQVVCAVIVVTASYSVQAAVPVDFSSLVEQVSPAVVSVNATKTLSQQELMQQQVPDLLRRFFGNQIIVPQQPVQQERTAFGSAFFISQDGYLLTNHHVIKDAAKVTITLNDRREIDAEIVGSDERTDVALLKVKGLNFPSLRIGNVNQLKVGEPVLAIGSPFGFDYSASAGIVSAKSRTVFNEAAVPFIQTDVALNPGNSGGPLFNQKGEVVGVNSRIFSGTGGYMGLSFSIPIDVAMDVVNQIKTTGKVSRPYLGVMLQDIDRNLAEAYQLDKPEGTLITQIAPNSPASIAGLKAGDVILGFNDQNLNRTADLINLINRTAVNQKVNLKILRNQQRQTVPVILVSAPDETPPTKETKLKNNANADLGMTLRDLTAQEKSRYAMQGVVVQDVSYTGLAAQSGIEQYDVIIKIGTKEIKGLTDFRQVVENLPQKGVIPVYLLRQNQPIILGLRLNK